jgi:uncharacterized protein YjbI with pentapeptide repeats
MANDEHVALLKGGVAGWNAWRNENKLLPDLSGAVLNRAHLHGANLNRADLSNANLAEANLSGGDLSNANLSDAYLHGANLNRANLNQANLKRAYLVDADLSHADLGMANLSEGNLFKARLSEANLGGADLHRADFHLATLFRANFHGANLNEARLHKAHLLGANLTKANLVAGDLSGADLNWANLRAADLTGALLSRTNLSAADLTKAVLCTAVLENATLVETNLTDADLTGCFVYGISAWDLKLKGSRQQNLVITRYKEPEITVDNIEVAQFIYLMLHNQKIREVIDTITSKAILILGRFTDERKEVLDALRKELRKRNYLPILFDFDVPAARDITETVSLLARMARFIIADLTDPRSIPKELEAIVPHLAVPVQPLLEGSFRPYSMFKDYWKYDWVLPVYRYEGLEPLLATLPEMVIAPAEGKVKALEQRRRMIEAELIKPQ